MDGRASVRLAPDRGKALAPAYSSLASAPLALAGWQLRIGTVLAEALAVTSCGPCVLRRVLGRALPRLRQALDEDTFSESPRASGPPPDWPGLEEEVVVASLDAHVRLEAALRSLDHAGTTLVSTASNCRPTVLDYHTEYESGMVTPTEVAERLIAFLERHNPRERWLTAWDAADIRAQAAAAAARYAAGASLSVFDGVPFVVKDLLPALPYPTTCGTAFMTEPAAADAPCVSVLREMGAVLLGKSALNEFGCLAHGCNAHAGSTRNPHDGSRLAGGSSAGSCAAVAAGLVPVAIGTDGGGSCRIPASYCGVVGLKPTLGRLADDHAAHGGRTSLIVSGPIAGSVADAALLYALMANVGYGDGGDGGDGGAPRRALGLPRALLPLRPGAAVNGERVMEGLRPLEGLRLGVMREWADDCAPGVRDVVRAALAALEGAGAAVVEVAIPELDLAAVAHLVTWAKEVQADGAAQGWLRDWALRRQLNCDTRLFVASGAALTDADYAQAQRIRTRVLRHFEAAFEACDVIVTPATPHVAPRMPREADTTGVYDPPANLAACRFTQAANLTGLPGLVVPAGRQAGVAMPVGLQLMGRPWAESTLLRTAAALEQALLEAASRSRASMADDELGLFGSDDDEQQQQPAAAAPPSPSPGGEEAGGADAGAGDADGDDGAARAQAEYEAGLEDDMDEDEPPAGARGAADGGGGAAPDEDDLFGGPDDDDDDDAPGAAPPAEAEARGPPIDVHAPLLPRPPPGRVVVMRLPNVLRIDPRPYDPEAFDGGAEEYVDERGVTRVRPRDINVIRWRYRPGGGEGGAPARESNARYVRWSDGSEGILLGDEVLDVTRQAAARAHSYLFAVRYDTIEGQAHLDQRVTVTPASLDSKLHKRLKMTVTQAAHRADKVRMHYASKNPELEKAEKEKAAAEAAQLKAARERAAGRAAPRPRRPAFTAAYLEEDGAEAYDAYDGGAYGSGDEEQEEELARRGADEDAEAEAAQRLRSAKRASPPPLGGGRKRGGRESDEDEPDEPAPPPAEERAAAAPGITSHGAGREQHAHGAAAEHAHGSGAVDPALSGSWRQRTPFLGRSGASSRLCSADHVITVADPSRRSVPGSPSPGRATPSPPPLPPWAAAGSDAEAAAAARAASAASTASSEVDGGGDLSAPLLQHDHGAAQFAATAAARAQAAAVALALAAASSGSREHLERAAGPFKGSFVDLAGPGAAVAAAAEAAGGALPAGGEQQRRFQRQLAFAYSLSWLVNILLLVAKLYAFWVSQSKAVLASAADSAVDLVRRAAAPRPGSTRGRGAARRRRERARAAPRWARPQVSQMVIAYTDWKIKRQDPRFPVGQARLEAIGVLACACIMSVASFEVISESVQVLVEAYITGEAPVLNLGLVMYVVLGTATGLKGVCWAVCAALQGRSDSMLALAEDHLNDIFSNLTAIATAVLAGVLPGGWWVDPSGAIAISAYIVVRWLAIAKQQVDKIVGRGAPALFIEQLEALANSHHEAMGLDVIRAYHFGARYIVEMEVLLPATMSVRDSHDISLDLQHKVEMLDEVERAFIHVDYERRDGLEHKVERELALASARELSAQGSGSAGGARHADPAVQRPSSAGSSSSISRKQLARLRPQQSQPPPPATAAAAAAERPAPATAAAMAPLPPLDDAAFLGAARVTAAFLLLIAAALIRQGVTRTSHQLAAKKAGKKYVRAEDRTLLPLDRTVGNFLEWGPVFLGFFWVSIFITGGATITAGWVYVAARAAYPFAAAWGGVNSGGAAPPILVATVPAYLALGVIAAPVLRAVL
ncbi:hypothetical protein HT031_002697 [Scenedesmus sp. PABB004]|nr:hypothetical protein HT031_002697 [Scenedesmus sp. PABB004]